MNELLLGYSRFETSPPTHPHKTYNTYEVYIDPHGSISFHLIPKDLAPTFPPNTYSILPVDQSQAEPLPSSIKPQPPSQSQP